MWNVLVVRSGHGAACPTCGERLKPERRRPGRKFHRKGAERRDLAQAPPRGPVPARPTRPTAAS